MGDKKYLIFLRYLLGIIILLYLIKISFTNGDFKAFLEAGKLLKAGETPYNKWLFISEGNYCHYFYSPLWALTLIPFTYLPDFITNLLWLLANAFFLFRTWKLLNYYLEPLALDKREIRLILLLTVIMSLRFILYNFELIQMTVFLLWGLMESIRLFRDKKYLLGGILLALIINIKILPVVLIPWLIYRKEFKGFLYTVLFSLVFIWLPALFLGFDMNNLLLRDWWKAINPFASEHLIEIELGPHSLTALIPPLLTKTGGDLIYRRNILDLDLKTSILVLNFVRAVIILLTVYFLGWPPFKSARTKLHELRELGYIFLIVPLIFPHQQKYAFYLMVPAIFYISVFLVFHFEKNDNYVKRPNGILLIFLVVLFFILTTLSTDGIIGRYLNQIMMHYKTITYGSLILIVILALYPPNLLEEPTRVDDDESSAKQH